MTIATPLSVSGRWIVDADGHRVKLAGVNWAGAHQDAMTPGASNPALLEALQAIQPPTVGPGLQTPNHAAASSPVT